MKTNTSITTGCFATGFGSPGFGLGTFDEIDDARACQESCRDILDCVAFVYNPLVRKCYPKTRLATLITVSQTVVGYRECNGKIQVKE